MTVMNIPIGATNAADTSRRPSPNLWSDCPWADIISDPTYGSYVWDDFCPVATPSSAAAIGTLGQWAAWLASGQTVTDGIEEGGVAKFDGGTANKSTILTSNAGAFRFVGPSTGFSMTGGQFWMEARVAFGSIAASQQGVFIGLADHTSSQINSSDTTIIASGGNTLTATKNVFGFFNRTTTGPTEWSAVYQPAGGTAVYPTGLTTLCTTATGSACTAYAASTIKGQGTGFTKIGMRIDLSVQVPFLMAPATCPSGQTAGVGYRPSVKFFVNGLQLPAFLHPGILQATTFPVNAVFSPVINYMNIAGGTAPIYVDWIRFAQIASF